MYATSDFRTTGANVDRSGQRSQSRAAADVGTPLLVRIAAVGTAAYRTRSQPDGQYSFPSHPGNRSLAGHNPLPAPPQHAERAQFLPRWEPFGAIRGVGTGQPDTRGYGPVPVGPDQRHPYGRRHRRAAQCPGGQLSGHPAQPDEPGRHLQPGAAGGGQPAARGGYHRHSLTQGERRGRFCAGIGAVGQQPAG